MKNYKYLGATISAIGIFTGLLLFYLLSGDYMTVIHGKHASGRPDEAIAVIITYSMLGWLGISASALWGAALYGFLKEENGLGFWGFCRPRSRCWLAFFLQFPPRALIYPPQLCRFF